MKLAFFCLVILLLSNIPSIYYGWYLDHLWFDSTQHFLGGFFVALFFGYYLKDHLLPNKKLNNALIIIGATIFIGVVWEFAEYIANQTLVIPTKQYLGINAYFMGDLKDTVADLLLDILGALTIYLLHFFRSRNPHQTQAILENSRNSTT